jgi:TRAP-type C4-dicarboxylate transport system permease small subunit
MKQTQTGVLSPILRVHDIISRTAWQVAALSLGLVVVIFAYEVTMRYVFSAPTRWASDVVSFMLLVTVFLSAPWLARQRGHVAVTILPEMLPPRAERIVVVAGFVAAAIVCFWAAWLCIGETAFLRSRGTMTLTSFRIPKWWLLAVISYGLLDCGLQFLRAAMERNTEGRKPLSGEAIF